LEQELSKNTKYKRGQSGNPAGRPKGITDKRTALRELLEPHAAELVQVAVQRALDGDSTALKLCLDRLMAPLRARGASISLGHLGESMEEMGRAVMARLASGELTPDEAGSVMASIASLARVKEIDDLERRVATLEMRNA
jgi:uncharacterized protein DUF5681